MSFVPTGKTRTSVSDSLPPYEVYGARLSYFSQKLLTAFAWSGLPYVVKKKAGDEGADVAKRSGTHQIPVVRTGEGWVIADTTPIMKLMDSRMSRDDLFYPKGFTGALVAILEEYFDEWTPRVAVHYRWAYEECASVCSVLIAEDALADDVDKSAVEAVAHNVRSWGPKATRATGIVSPVQQTEGEQELKRVLSAANDALQHNDFLLGNAPTALDAVVIGALKAHFFHDPVPRDRLFGLFPHLQRYYDVNENAKPFCGESLQLQQIPQFAHFLLSEMAQNGFQQFIVANADCAKRGDKSFTVQVYGEQVSYLCRSYPLLSSQMLSETINTHVPLSHPQRALLLSTLHSHGLSQWTHKVLRLTDSSKM